MMNFMDEKTRHQVAEALGEVKTELELVVYTGGRVMVPGKDGPGEQEAALRLLREMAEISDKLTVTERSLVGDDEARELGITLAPTILMREKGSERSNIRFVGLPAGYEFATLIGALQLLGNGNGSLEGLEKIDTPVRLQSFVTPTCPYCPRAVLTAYKLAYANPNIVAEGVEASEFPLLAQRYRISSVPDTIITGEAEETRVLGAQPERAFVAAVLKAAGLES
jgi:glutaredoxin-like protein